MTSSVKKKQSKRFQWNSEESPLSGNIWVETQSNWGSEVVWERVLQVEETVLAKAPRQEHAWSVQSAARRAMWLSRRGLEKMRPKGSGGPCRTLLVKVKILNFTLRQEKFEQKSTRSKTSFWLLCGEDAVAGQLWEQEGRPSKRLFQLSSQETVVVWTRAYW